MFKLDGNMTFINVDTDYLKKMHDVCPEVYYRSEGYDNKPYIGILISQNDRKYVIPLSSAKNKHREWKNVKHILSVLNIKKMIPIVEGIYEKVNINADDEDSEVIKKYKDLLNKEYSFCLKIIDDVIKKANRLYAKQMTTGKVSKFCCDFRVLEMASNNYSQQNEKRDVNDSLGITY